MLIFIIKIIIYCLSIYSPARFIRFFYAVKPKHFYHSDWDTSKTWFWNASTASSGDENSLQFNSLFPWCAVIKRSQGCTADEPSIRHFGRSKTRWFELMCESLHCHGTQWSMFSCSFFRISPQTAGQHCGVPLRIDRPALLKRRSRHMTSFTKETRPFSPKCFFHEQLLFGFGSTSKTHNVDCCFVFWFPTKKTFFTARCSRNMEGCWWRNYHGCLCLTVCHMMILHFELTHCINVLWQIDCFVRPSSEFWSG